MVKRWVMCLKSSPLSGISGWASQVRSHAEEAKPLWPGRHWYLLVAPCGGPQLLDVLHQDQGSAVWLLLIPTSSTLLSILFQRLPTSNPTPRTPLRTQTS